MGKVFLCHSSVDKPFARRLADELSRQCLDVWIDEKEILVGDPIRQKIEEGLKNSDYLAIVLSPESVKSQWVQKELDAKLIEEIESREVCVLPLLYRDCDIPLFLKGKHYADFRSNFEDGITEVLSRLRRNDEEMEVKRKVLQRLGSLDPSRIDTHLLMQVAISTRSLDDAEELITAHEKGHVGCVHVRGSRAVLKVMRYSQKPGADTYIDALRNVVDLCLLQPQAPHLKNVQQLTDQPFKDPSCLATIFSLAEAVLERIKNGGNAIHVGLLSCLLFAANHQQRSRDDDERVSNLAIQTIENQTAENLQHALGRLLNLMTHALQARNPSNKEDVLRQLIGVAGPKTADSQESEVAFLHLAWANALLGSRTGAKEWLQKYKLAVPATKFSESIRKHPPLAEFVGP